MRLKFAAPVIAACLGLSACGGGGTNSTAETNLGGEAQSDAALGSDNFGDTNVTAVDGAPPLDNAADAALPGDADANLSGNAADPAQNVTG